MGRLLQESEREATEAVEGGEDPEVEGIRPIPEETEPEQDPVQDIAEQERNQVEPDQGQRAGSKDAVRT